MDRILNWTVQYSANTLETLILDENDLTIIPLQLRSSSFPKLQYISLNKQSSGIPLIPSGSFHVISPNYTLSVDSNDIESIEEGAFQGNSLFIPEFNLIMNCNGLFDRIF